MENELYQRWDEILEHMKVSFDITDVSYRTFIKILSIYSVEDNRITILIDDINIGNSKSFIEKKYNRFLSVAIEEITGIHYELSYLSLTALDLKIVKNGPSERRRFINLELSQLDKVYLYELGEYNKALMQRNKLLKQISFKPSLYNTLDVWDSQLAGFGSKVIISREKFIKNLSVITKKINEKLTGGREHIELLYEPDIGADSFLSALKKNREKDLHFLSTSTGPHKDDLCFINNGIDIRKYGSQGQQRTCALSLKLAEIELVKEVTNDTPVLLLDDVLSELDRNRQNYLLDSIDNIQTIITCTGLEEFIDGRLSLDKVFCISEGTVILEK